MVWFLEEETGIVVMNATDSQEVAFATKGHFDENVFELLPPDECVRLSN